MSDGYDTLSEDDIEQIIWTLENSTDEIDQQAMTLINLWKQRSDLGWHTAMEALARLQVLRAVVDQVLDNPYAPELWEDEVKRASVAVGPDPYQNRVN